MDLSRWMKQITTIDEHDRCEWLNVSSGTGSPGFPGQNSESHNTVVCVCVCLCADEIFEDSERGSLSVELLIAVACF